MLRISKNTNKIVSIQMSTKQETTPEGYTPPEIDSFIIIPGVTTYNNIYTKDNWLVFDSQDSYIGVQFSNEADLERFFIQLMRDIKLNQITNVSIDTKTN
jgi:hypothetical protein